MKHYPIERIDSCMHVEGFPDAIRHIKLNGPRARRIAHLLLHRHDLAFADACLDTINSAPEEPPIIREALWRSAIINYTKCFGSSAARFQLSREKIYKGEPPESRLAFEYFQNLRDKHIVHDENSYSQSIPGAILNRGNKSYKIEEILCVIGHTNTLEQANYGNLKLLIQKALEWVAAEFDTCCNIVKEELEAIPYHELLKWPEVTYRVPLAEEIRTKRDNGV